MQILIRHKGDQVKMNHLSCLFTDNNIDSNMHLRGSRKFCERGSDTDNFFLYYFITLLVEKSGVKYHYKGIIVGPPAKRHFNGVSLACRWWPNMECWFGSFAIFQGSGPVLPWDPIFLWFFRGGGGPDPLPPPPTTGSAHDARPKLNLC